MAQIEPIANRRLPVKKATWEAMHRLRTPGQTFDEYLREQIPSMKALAESYEGVLERPEEAEGLK